MSSIGRVLVIGTGLMGTSLALALRRSGVDVLLEDRDRERLRIAVSLGAGHPMPVPSSSSTPEPPVPLEPESSEPPEPPAPLEPESPEPPAPLEPDLVVVGVPPSALAAVVVRSLERFPGTIVTDLGSVKATVAAEVIDRAPELADRYVGGHPMAGSERSGPLAARADLFDGRAWAITPHDGGPGALPSRTAGIERLEQLATACGAFTVRFTPAEHDEAVALVSHVPQVASSVVAGLLAGAEQEQLLLAGQGLRDVTRIAAGDPELWTQILSANARPVARLLHAAAADLGALATALDATDVPADLLTERLTRGVQGVHRLPGKHARPGMPAEEFTSVTVRLPDRPGELARLFADVGSAGVNIEDLRIDHSPAESVGLVELSVVPSSEGDLLAALERHGWSIHG